MNKEKVKEELPSVKEDVSLKKETTFKAGGPAELFLEAETEEEIIRGVRTAKKEEVPFFILGGGSNLLVSSSGFSGLVIKTINSGIKREENRVTVLSGTNLADLVSWSTKKSLSGMEWAAGIPGKVGGAVRGNAAAFGGCMANSLVSVRAFDPEEDKVKEFSRADCGFGEKKSCFKKHPELVVLSAVLQLEPGDPEKMEKETKKNIDYRWENHPMSFSSAGCIFKNVLAEEMTDESLFKKFPLLKKFKKRGTIPTGYLIEKAGLEGERRGGAEISEEHANFIVNLGGASGEEIKELICLAKKKVKEVFGLEIEEEITYLGF